MQSEQLSSAEKAEQRRQKILAKKAARMAYASGNHTKPPSTMPSESVQAPEPVRDRSSDATSEPSVPILTSMPTPETLNALRMPNGGQHRCPADRPSVFAAFPTQLQRILLFATVAIARTIVISRQQVVDWRISMVELFLLLELVFIAPLVLRDVWRALTASLSANGTSASPLSMIMGAGKYVAVLSYVAGDFAVFMLSFLCSWYIIDKMI